MLPEALLLSAKQGEKLSTALSPTVEEIIRVSVKRNIRTFADLLFPVIGPAIRKAMSETLKQMIQSLSQAVENSLSWQGLKWRLESMRSGRPFAEIVLLHSLVYRVEQVFLIHPESGLLLQHVAVETEAFQDADLVSGMLTAIQDFVRDSFNVEEEQALNSIQMGDFTIWLVQGPKAVIAGAIRGNAPESLRQVFNNALENIHLEQAEVLDASDVDPTLLEPVRDHLKSCLQTRFKQAPRKFSPLLVVSLLVIAVVLGLWLFLSIRDHLRWEDYLQQLKMEPGIIVTETDKQDGVYRIYGLRDPLAKNPVEILSTHPIEHDKIVHRFRPYQALSDELVLQRARRILVPPATVTLSFSRGLLKISGTAPHSWIVDTRRLARVLPGIMELDDSELSTVVDLSSLAAPDTVSLSLRDGLLTARGSAP
ncbi:MAG: OmpA family protein [gamma proteobacterium endosymbiont of Lamellibrachia anaximandri]|nr:OmpA family protein [gamma proteobacterium endosymbiont of Lamellibrachia anaximandri]